MKVSSIRLGHANNSSSSHSILINSTTTNVPPRRDGFFGRDWFHLREKKDKRLYLAAQIFNNLPETLNIADRLAIICDILSITKADLPVVEEDYDLGVDHQSAFFLPVIRGEYQKKQSLDREFIADLDEFLCRDKVTIFGGNDESESPPHDGEIRDMPFTDCGGQFVARKDGDWWVLYNRETGAKVRISFKDDPSPYVFSTMPELVDLKLTDWCAFGCKGCYQGSTPEGKHANKDRIEVIIHALQVMEVFEVALGGGETTQYPQFRELLEYLSWGNSLTPNFTSFNMQWAQDAKLAQLVRDVCGSFAISSSDPKTMQALHAWNEATNYHGVKGNLQVVLGFLDFEEMTARLEAAHELGLGVTFLGYKRVGRGAVVEPKEHGNILRWLKENRWNRFGADQVFVEEFKAELDAMGIHPSLRVGAEGGFSMYIDGVKMRYGPSSYCPEDQMISFVEEHNLEREILEHFPFV